MPDILREIAARIQEDLKGEKRNVDLTLLKKQMKDQAPAVPFAAALRKPGEISVIAELKQASPSAGVIRKESDLEGRIEGYVKGGARALSILTERHYFHGSPDILKMARKRTALPILRKDFIVDHYQVEQTRAMGADVILLIAALLGGQLKEFMEHAQEVGLEPLVEVHEEREVEQALHAGAAVIGVNNRNLSSLEVSMETAQRLIPMIPPEGHTIIVESGIKRPEELQQIYTWGAHAVLMGETLMKEPNAEKAVRVFTDAGRAVTGRTA